MVARLRRVPAWAWLVALVLASSAVRAWLARDMQGPFIMVDELYYSELARSIADSGELLIRGVPSSGYGGVVYPALISPAYAIFDRLTDAYTAVKTLNALVMSLAAVPAYLLARRVVGTGISLLAAVLAVSLPSLVYTGSVMTENAFYPVFLVVALLFTLVLESPTTIRQIAPPGSNRDRMRDPRAGCRSRSGAAYGAAPSWPLSARKLASRAPAVSLALRTRAGRRSGPPRRPARARPVTFGPLRRVQHRRRV